MRVLFFSLLLCLSHGVLATQPSCAENSGAYKYGFSVGNELIPRLLEASEVSAIENLFKSIASKSQRHGALTEFYCRGQEKSTSDYRVNTSTNYNYERLLFLRSDVVSRGKSASFVENLRLKIDEGYLQLWGLNGGTGIDLIRATPGLLVYREIRRTRRAGGGFTERQFVNELEYKSGVYSLTQHIYINKGLYGWRLWQY